jgi:hypothetical protein
MPMVLSVGAWIVEHWLAAVLMALLLGLSVVWLEGCSTLAKPQTMNQRIAYAEATLVAVYETIGSLKTSGRIDAAKRDELVKEADKAGIAVDAARTALANGLPDDALGRLQAAQAILVTLQRTLQELQP